MIEINQTIKAFNYQLGLAVHYKIVLDEVMNALHRTCTELQAYPDTPSDLREKAEEVLRIIEGWRTLWPERTKIIKNEKS